MSWSMTPVMLSPLYEQSLGLRDGVLRELWDRGGIIEILRGQGKQPELAYPTGVILEVHFLCHRDIPRRENGHAVIDELCLGAIVASRAPGGHALTVRWKGARDAIAACACCAALPH